MFKLHLRRDRRQLDVSNELRTTPSEVPAKKDFSIRSKMLRIELQHKINMSMSPISYSENGMRSLQNNIIMHAIPPWIFSTRTRSDIGIGTHASTFILFMVWPGLALPSGFSSCGGYKSCDETQSKQHRSEGT